MSQDYTEARRDVIAYCHRMQAEHLVYSTAGNVSVRIDGELIAMTPTSFPYDALEPEDVCIVNTAGDVIDGRREPTSELPLHTLVYARRPEVGAIIHTHSQMNQARSCAGRASRVTRCGPRRMTRPSATPQANTRTCILAGPAYLPGQPATAR